jgi:hypothetical protein
MKSRIIILAFLVLCILSISSNLKGEEEVTIDKLKYDELICGDDVSKEDLEGHVVGVKYWGKW